MNREQIFSVLLEIKYKDWRLNYYDQGKYIQWEFDSGEQVWKCRKWRISEHTTISELIQTCFMAALAAEEHEAREAFTYRGVAVLGPHWDLEQKAQDIIHGRIRESTRMVQENEY